VSGLSVIVVPGSRSTGCRSRCSRKVMWKEFNMALVVVSTQAIGLIVGCVSNYVTRISGIHDPEC
jgi:hypothetical protein